MFYKLFGDNKFMEIISGNRPEIGEEIKTKKLISLSELKEKFSISRNDTIWSAVERSPYRNNIVPQYIMKRPYGFTLYFIYTDGENDVLTPSDVVCPLHDRRRSIENKIVFQEVCEKFCKNYSECYKCV